MNNFVPPPSFISLLNQPRGILRKGQVTDRVHSTLIDIAELVPLSPLRLEKIVKEKMQKMPINYTKEPVSADTCFLYKEDSSTMQLIKCSGSSDIFLN